MKRRSSLNTGQQIGALLAVIGLIVAVYGLAWHQLGWCFLGGVGFITGSLIYRPNLILDLVAFLFAHLW